MGKYSVFMKRRGPYTYILLNLYLINGSNCSICSNKSCEYDAHHALVVSGQTWHHVEYITDHDDVKSAGIHSNYVRINCS